MKKLAPLWAITIAYVILLILVFGILESRREYKYLEQNNQVYRDLRQISAALEGYFADHRCYPRMIPLRNFSVNPDYNTRGVDINTSDPLFSVLEKAGGDELMTIDPGWTLIGVAGLTTPVAYLKKLLPDPFINHQTEKNIPYAYHVYENPAGYIIHSTGPDKDYDL